MRGSSSAYVFFFIIQILIFSSSEVQSQQIPQNNGSQFINNPVVTEQVYRQLTIGTQNLIQSELAQQANFCITDPEEDWNRAFNYSGNLDFVANCLTTTGGDLPQRICTAAELRFYFANFISTARGSLQPNRNCNTSIFVSGCEPGWACNTGSNAAVDYESTEIPARTSSCGPCCEGFFCPQGLTCMIPCPLGSYCPIATLNVTTSLCDPYPYSLPAGRNHTCGGADMWADVSRSSSMFCSAGSYCPTNTQEIECRDGHFCRMGSTRQRRCMPFTSCDASESRQNITQYGIMLIVAISFLLFIFYTCYGQAISLREKRDARSREYAVRTAKENAQARAHWQTARDGIKKIARSFSRINTYRGDHQDDMLSEIEEVHTGKEKKDSKKKKTKAVHINKDAQNFSYAYSQLEKEKAQQNQDLTFSEAIKMTVDNEARRRPPIVIAFRNLTVTLKHKKKDILKSVTGEVSPGRITALMGPSGAGKTTLLSALTGKTVGCVLTGSILINGKADPIRSYKKIVGFVPQDDVVHGNLTVQENIWFSANCRLPADLSKARKVLIVERVIDSLGLQHVRDSLVGTVEKRGISGGQKKRVNVGLELVMEPSLLFLDEPTSGLDSSSSQLLLRALRREAREGVNICMVVHQPSYSLFQMFDDLILLAKGGRTVYHGPVGEVEDYFSHLGIKVPERINPPDYFIDVLEGMIKLNASLGLGIEELPLRWMLHKGYPVPKDMQKHLPKPVGHEIQILSTDQEPYTGHAPAQPSFWLEFLQNFKYKFEGRLDVIQNNFKSSRDLSGRKTPSIVVQYVHFLGRLAKQRLREARTQAIDFLILLLAGACLGLIARSSDQTFGAPGYTYTIIAVSLLCKIAALRTFSLDKLNYQRERASGISSFAHFIAKDTIDHFNTVIKPLVYLSMFFFFSNLRSTFQANYIVLLCLVYCVTGIAYVLAIFFEPGPSQLCSVLLPVVLTLLSTQPQDSQFMRNLTNLCYPRWALEAFIVSNARSYSGVWLIQRCGALLRTGYNLHEWNRCIVLLMAVGAACRMLAFFGMLILKKK